MTAEAAVVIPALVLLVAGLLWGLMAAVTRIQCVDAARAGARAAARGETGDGVARAVRSAAPPGARLEVTQDGELVRVAVRARTVGPGPLTVELRSEAVAMDEARAETGDDAGGAGTGRSQGRSHGRTPATGSPGSAGSPGSPGLDDARGTEGKEE